MKPLLKVRLFLLIQLLPLLLLAQTETTPAEPDDNFNLFLLLLGSSFIAGMIGAAIIGAFFAMLLVLLAAGLFGFAIFSTSFFIGLFKRSFSAGFKSLLFLFFGSTCAGFGWIGFLFFNQLFSLQLSPLETTLIGLSAGFLGGVVLASVVIRIVRDITYRILHKKRLANVG